MSTKTRSQVSTCTSPQLKGGTTATTIIQGDALQIIRNFEPNTFAAVITDPPYSSGGMTKDSRAQATSKKYTSTKEACPFPDFEGDARDQRSWTNWMAEWMADARRACISGAPICLFIDWRQLPSLTDALQWAGWIWRGIVPWDKVNSRPQKGRFKQQSEFVVWGSNGPMPVDRCVPVLPGILRGSMPTAKDREHQTQKPLEVMRQIVRICEPGGHILDPFVGSGTTLEAARLEGYEATGIEIVPYYAQISEDRMTKGE